MEVKGAMDGTLYFVRLSLTVLLNPQHNLHQGCFKRELAFV